MNNNKIARFMLNSVSGLIPGLGGIFSAISGVWSEKEQELVNTFTSLQLEMMQDTQKEQLKTLIEIIQRLDFQDEQITNRIHSPEYQSLLKKAFRNWGAVESEEKRVYIRNILSNSASFAHNEITSDDVIRLFLEWINKYSDLHFKIIKMFYKHPNSTRYTIWEKLNKPIPREDSAEADLYKMVIYDLSTGHIIRQYRTRDYHGNFIKQGAKKSPLGYSSKYMKSAFDDDKHYELTDLGSQFIHYAIQDLPIKLEYKEEKH